MKHLFFFFFIILLLPSYAQNSFEGTVKWGITIVNTDSKQAAQYQQDISREDLSEQNEAIIELEQQLNDPEMKEILLAHPTIKNNMQKRLQELKAAQPDPSVTASNSTKSIFPSTIYIRLKNGNSLMEMEGGTMRQMVGDVLYLKKQNSTFYIKDATETFSIKPESLSDTSRHVHITMTKTKDSLVLLRYNCFKYIVTCTENNETRISTVWITREIKNMNPYSFQSLSTSTGNLHNDAFEAMPGIPLRIESYEKGVKMTMEVVDITEQLLPDSDFSIPITYKEAVYGY